MTEKQFQTWVVSIAKLNGWLVYHTYDSRRSEPGFPDLVMVRGGQVIFAELKTEHGKLKPKQKQWIMRLARVGSVEVEIWRPQYEKGILAMLEGK